MRTIEVSIFLLIFCSVQGANQNQSQTLLKENFNKNDILANKPKNASSIGGGMSVDIDDEDNIKQRQQKELQNSFFNLSSPSAVSKSLPNDTQTKLNKSIPNTTSSNSRLAKLETTSPVPFNRNSSMKLEQKPISENQELISGSRTPITPSPIPPKSLNPFSNITLSPLLTTYPFTTPKTSPALIPSSTPFSSISASLTKPPAITPSLTPAPTTSSPLKPTTSSPLKPTSSPTLKPTLPPTLKPTLSPTLKPTSSPILTPTLSPTLKPTSSPTLTPTSSPTLKPTSSPTLKPTSSSSPALIQESKINKPNESNFLKGTPVLQMLEPGIGKVKTNDLLESPKKGHEPETITTISKTTSRTFTLPPNLPIQRATLQTTTTQKSLPPTDIKRQLSRTNTTSQGVVGLEHDLYPPFMNDLQPNFGYVLFGQEGIIKPFIYFPKLTYKIPHPEPKYPIINEQQKMYQTKGESYQNRFDSFHSIYSPFEQNLQTETTKKLAEIEPEPKGAVNIIFNLPISVPQPEILKHSSSTTPKKLPSHKLHNSIKKHNKPEKNENITPFIKTIQNIPKRSTVSITSHNQLHNSIKRESNKKEENKILNLNKFPVIDIDIDKILDSEDTPPHVKEHLNSENKNYLLKFFKGFR